MKKILITILFGLFCSTAWAATRYVKNGGTDSGAAESDETAWATLSHAMANSNCGDTVSLNRGDIWREQLVPKDCTAGNVLTINAYGTGDKPKIVLAVETSSGDWTETSPGSNVWKYTANSNFNSIDCGNIIFGGIGTETGVGIKNKDGVTPDADREFLSVNDGSGDILLYSTSNPVTRWGTVNLSFTANCAEAIEKDYVTVENIELRYCSGNAFQFTTTSHITANNIDVKYVGGGRQSSLLRYGNGLDIIDTNSDFSADGWTFDNVYETAIAIESSTDGNDQTDISITNPTVTNSCTGIEWNNSGATSTSTNVSVSYGTFRGSGKGWGDANSQENRWTQSICHHYFTWGSDATTSNVSFTNNNFYDGEDLTGVAISAGSGYFGFYRAADISKVIIDYNTYYASGMESGQFAYYHTPTPTVYEATQSGFSDWKTASGQDAHSTLSLGTNNVSITGATFSGITIN